MTNTAATRLNYSAHVIERMRHQMAENSRRGDARDVVALEGWIAAIRDSVKYQLPPMGRYISDARPLAVGTMPQRMPFTVMSLEIPFSESGDDAIRGEGLLASTRRHVLMREACPANPRNPMARDYVFGRDSATGIHMQLCAWLDHRREWAPLAYGCFLPYDAPAVEGSPSGRDGRAYGSNSVPQILPDLHDHLVAQIGYAEVARNTGIDVADEVRVVVEFLQVLACRNVRAIDVPPSKALNRQRERKGKEPFDTVRILTVGDVAIGGAKSVGSQSDEDGYKVREHLRTGHIRRLPGYNTWVNDCIVAPGSPLGRAAKSYAVR